MLVVARELLVIWGDCIGSAREPRDRWRHLSTPRDSSFDTFSTLMFVF